jgi:hypothetical protein
MATVWDVLCCVNLMTTRNQMKINVFRGLNKFGIEEVERPRAGVGDAVVRVTPKSPHCGNIQSKRAQSLDAMGHGFGWAH